MGDQWLTYGEAAMALESVIDGLKDLRTSLPGDAAMRSRLEITAACSKLRRAIAWMPDDDDPGQDPGEGITGTCEPVDRAASPAKGGRDPDPLPGVR